MMVPVGRLVLFRSVERSQLVRTMAYLQVPAQLGPVLGPPCILQRPLGSPPPCMAFQPWSWHRSGARCPNYRGGSRS